MVRGGRTAHPDCHSGGDDHGSANDLYHYHDDNDLDHYHDDHSSSYHNAAAYDYPSPYHNAAAYDHSPAYDYPSSYHNAAAYDYPSPYHNAAAYDHSPAYDYPSSYHNAAAYDHSPAYDYPSTMMVSCMCLTYGRAGLLEESIESFLRQDYTGDSELIVVNDLPEQELVLPDCPANVRVVNLQERCNNLGHKRNVVAEMCSGDLLMTWSDDDIHLPSRITNNVAAFSSGTYVTEGRYVFLHGENSRLVARRMCGPFLMARSDFWELGGIPDADNGEDLLFLNKATKALKLKLAEGTNYVYRWDTGRYHASHHDKKEGAWETYRRLVLRSIETGAEPSGRVVLRPQWKQDYVATANSFLS